MNAIDLAKTAYGTPNAPVRTDRSVEYALFSRITQRLKAAMDRGPEEQFAALAEAIHANRQLWTTLAADVADPGNGLPSTLRARIFYLAEFTAVQSAKVLNGSGNAAALVDINTAVMRGLGIEGRTR